jgi:hypothetical protein
MEHAAVIDRARSPIGENGRMAGEPTCHADANKERCNCTYPGCARHGICCECLAYHLKKQQLPACAFPPEVEKTWDRSFRRFIETQG